MDKDKLPSHGGGGQLPPSGRFPSFTLGGSGFNMSSEGSSTAFPPLGGGSGLDSGRFGHGMPSSDSGRFSHDISQMPDNPPKNMGHRRAHSEILTLPDDLNFDSDLGVVGVMDGPSFSDDTEEDLLSMYLDMEKFNSSSPTSFPSSDTMNTTTPASLTGTNQSVNAAGSSGERPRVRHQHSQSMDGSSPIKAEMLMSAAEEASASDSKKAISAAKLAELALVDPKRAKRIWANRQSAARSKERKMRYIAELEKKVQMLQTDATSLSAQLALLQRDTNNLTAENSELKLRLQTMEQQVHLQDALNDALKEEIQHLKVLTGQVIPNGGPMMNYPSFGGNRPHYPSSNQSMHTMMAAQQFQQLQLHSQKQQQQNHQFQQHQLLQRQQQQELRQQQLDQQQNSGGLSARIGMGSPGQKDGASEPSESMKE